MSQPSPTTPPDQESPSPPFQPPTSSAAPPTTAPLLGVRRIPSASTESGEAPSGGYAADPLDSEPPTDTRSASDARAGAAAPRPLKVGGEVADAIRGVVLGAGVMLHQGLARTDYEQSAGVWLMEEDQAADIADPLAAIAKRRAGGALVSNDLGDLIRAGLAAAGYLLVNGIKTFQIRRALRRMSTVPGFTEDENQEGDPQE